MSEEAPRKERPRPPAGCFTTVMLVQATLAASVIFVGAAIPVSVGFHTIITSIPPYVLMAAILVPLIPALVALARRRLKTPGIVMTVLLLGATFGVSGFELPKPPAPAVKAPINFVTFNRLWLVEDFARLRAELDRNPADIIYLQEVPPQLHDDLPRVFPEMDVYASGTNAILSRWPMRNREAVPMASFPTREFLIAQVQVPNGPEVRLVNAHLTAPQISRFNMANAAQNKANEREQLLEILGRDKMPVILAGDFNAPALHGLVRELGRTHHNAFARRGQGFGFTFAASLPAIRIDHIFVSRDLEVESVKVEPDWGSDHLALRAIIGIR